MKTTDLVHMSMRSLWRRKLRTFLTVLGVIIGAASVMLMLSIGLGMEKSMEAQFAMWGDLTLVYVSCYGGESSNAPVLDTKAIGEIEKVAHVKKVVPNITANAYLSVGKYRTPWPWSIKVMEPDELEALGYRAVEGRDLREEDENAVVMGENVLQYLTKNGKEPKDYGNLVPIEFDRDKDKLTLEVIDYDMRTGKPYLTGPDGKIKEPKGINVQVVGLLSADKQEVAETVFIPRKLYEKFEIERKKYQKALMNEEERKAAETEEKNNKQKGYQEILVKVDNRENVVEVVKSLKEAGYDAYSDMEYIKQTEEQAKSKRLALGGIGIVSFIVAAIGIANTMMMSIYERTKEIGVMKVIGARLEDIKKMFLFEALMIGLIGGILGAGLSLGISMLLNHLGDRVAQMLNMWDTTTVSVMPLWLILMGIGFSTLVGLISGYFPARKAMKLSALSAIKTE